MTTYENIPIDRLIELKDELQAQMRELREQLEITGRCLRLVRMEVADRKKQKHSTKPLAN